MSTRRVATISFGIAVVSAAGMALAVQQAAEVLDYKYKPGVIVVVTNGEETCGDSSRRRDRGGSGRSAG